MHPFEVCNSVLLAQPCLTLCDPKTVTHQVPLSMEFFRQAYWSGLPFLSPGIFPAQGSNPHFPALTRGFFTHWAILSIFFFFKILDIQFTPKAYLLSVCYMLGIVVSASFSSVAQLCPSLCDPMDCAHQPPCPSPTPEVCSNSCPSSRRCHPSISSSVVPFSSSPQSFPASGSFSNESARDS